MNSGFPTIGLFGYQINCRGTEYDVAQALEFVNNGLRASYMACANPHSLVVAANDTLFREALQNANLLLPDGAGIVLAAKLLNTPIYEKVAGYEFFARLSDRISKAGGGRYFFLGSSKHILDLIVTRLHSEYTNITVCGIHSPPFKDTFSDTDNAEIIDAINQASPDVLWVGMTAPKQEKWIYQNRAKLNVPFIGAIGAVFDFYAGTKKRSSPFWRKLGLEWLPRFLKEPRRLWERNLKSTPIFLWWVFREKIRQMVNH